MQTVIEDPPSSRQPPERASGTVWSETLARLSTPPVVVNRAHFAPGARTCWHTHQLGQVLIIETGVALVQEYGGPVLVLRAGQSVVCDPGVRHWHGATPETAMTQLAVTPADDAGAVADWGETVVDEEYLAAARARTAG